MPVKLSWRDYEFDFSCKTHIMGILNITPDSFSDGGRFFDTKEAVRQAGLLAGYGADILDIGGESTRPGSEPVSADEEIRRVVPVIKAIAGDKGPGLPVSIDTTKAVVAEAAIQAGASVINDISGLHFDTDMARVAAYNDAPVIIMHIRGNPKTMQQSIRYDSLFSEIKEYIAEGIDTALKAGVNEDHILIDPGIGFGKTIEQNLEIIRNLGSFKKSLGHSVVLGTSRKAFIGKILDLPVNERIEGTAASVAIGIANGADMLRVHDVQAMARVAGVADAIIGKGKLQVDRLK